MDNRIFRMYADIHPDLRTIRLSIAEERLAKNGPTIVFSKPLILVSSSESRSDDKKGKIWEMDLSSRL